MITIKCAEMPYMKWGAKRRRSKPIYKRFTKRFRGLENAKSFSQFQRALQYVRSQRRFGRNPVIPKYSIRRTGYKVNTYTRMRTKRRLARRWR